MFSLPTLATGFIENGGAKIAALWAAVVGMKYVIKLIKTPVSVREDKAEMNREWKKYKRGE